MISLAAVLVMSFAASASAAPAPAGAAPAAAVPAGGDAWQAKALPPLQKSFLTQEPGKPTLDVAVKPEFPTDPAKAQAVEAIRVAIEAAKDVQLGCAAPCASAADIQVYSGKIELTARRLGMTGDSVQAVLKHYIPEGKPRLRGAPGAPTPGGQAMEAEVVARMLASEQLAPQLRAGLSRKAQAMADALGKTQALTADANGVVVLPGGQRAHMSPAQLAQLNAIPQTQASILRKLATTPPPAPTPQQKQDAALAEAEKEIQAHPGLIGDTYNYWKQEAENPNNGSIWKAYAKTNMGLLTVSGLKSVEESSARLGYVWDNPDVGKGEKFWLGTKLAGNAAMTAVSFLPAASFAKSVQAGEGFYWIGKGGAAIPGMTRAAEPAVAEAMGAGSRTVAKTVAETLPQGAKVGTPELRTLVTNLNGKMARYGVEVVEGGTTGESVAKGGKIYVSLKAGAQHEMIHVVQQATTRVTALEQIAAKSGTTVEALTKAQRAEAFANAERFEAASYSQLESQAFRGTGLMGAGGGTGYTNQLLLTTREVTTGMKNGAVVDGAFSIGDKVYGALPTVLGRSQAQIGAGVGSIFTGTLNTSAGDGARDMIDGYARPYTDPVNGTQRLINTGASVMSAATPPPANLIMRPVLNKYLIRPVP